MAPPFVTMTSPVTLTSTPVLAYPHRLSQPAQPPSSSKRTRIVTVPALFPVTLMRAPDSNLAETLMYPRVEPGAGLRIELTSR